MSARGNAKSLHSEADRLQALPQIPTQLRKKATAAAAAMRAALATCCEQPPHEQWVPLFKIQVFFSCVSFSIIVPSLANYLRRMGAE